MKSANFGEVSYFPAMEKQLIEKVCTNKHKGKGFRSSLFPERLAGFQRAEPLVVLAAVVNYVYLRNLFIDG